MEGDAVSDLVRQLVVRIFPSGSKGAVNGTHGAGHYHGQQRGELDGIVDRAHRYAMRIIGSRISPSLVNDEGAMAEAIKRQLVQENRSSDALTFADLHRRLASQSGPGCIENRWSLLYLLRAIAEDQRRERAETRGSAVPYTSTLSGAAVFLLVSFVSFPFPCFFSLFIFLSFFCSLFLFSLFIWHLSYQVIL